MPPLLKCGWMDTLFGRCGCDPDEAFGFKAEKKVKINDRVLGCFSLLLTVTIIAIVIVDLFLSYRYMELVPPSGAAIANVYPPPFTAAGLNPATSCDTRPPMSTLSFPYCITDDGGNPSDAGANGVVQPCLWWEQGRYTTPITGEQVFVTTRVKQQTYGVPCDTSYLSASGHRFTAVNTSCVMERSRGGEYPTKESSFTGFVAGADDATVKVEHGMSAEWTKINFDGGTSGVERTMRGMDGWLVDCHGNKVRHLPKQGATDTWCDLYNNRLFKLKELLSVASMGVGESRQCGIELDETQLKDVALADEAACRGRNLLTGCDAACKAKCVETYRYTGLVLILRISYDNLYQHTSGHSEPRYTITAHAQANADAEYERTSFPQLGVVQKESRRGVLIVLQQEGALGHFSWVRCVGELAGVIGLITVAKAITVLISRFICSKITGDLRYKTSLVEETDDFNELHEQRGRSPAGSASSGAGLRRGTPAAAASPPALPRIPAAPLPLGARGPSPHGAPAAARAAGAVSAVAADAWFTDLRREAAAGGAAGPLATQSPSGSTADPLATAPAMDAPPLPRRCPLRYTPES